jgi:acyl-CoA thioester hydrolase
MTVGGHRRSFPTRWADNDVYGHLNNTIYYAAMDSTINSWMIDNGLLDIEAGAVLGVCAASSCRFAASASFPDVLSLELSVGRLGNTSVTWTLAISRERDGLALATGEFVHVFVDRKTRRPVPIPANLRATIVEQLEVAS